MAGAWQHCPNIASASPSEPCSCAQMSRAPCPERGSQLTPAAATQMLALRELGLYSSCSSPHHAAGLDCPKPSAAKAHVRKLIPSSDQPLIWNYILGRDFRTTIEQEGKCQHLLR